MKPILTAFVAVLSTATPTLAQDFTQEQIAAAMRFSMGDAAYTMYHEIGHLLVNELGIPVLGKEEDAADALAVLMLLNDESDNESYVRLIDAADGWYFKAQNVEVSSMSELGFVAAHSLGIQRAYAMACLMLGKDQDYFSNVGDFYEIDQDTRDSCAYTYEQTNAAWNALLAPHLVTDEPNAEIEIIYDEPGEGYELYMQALQDARILEHAAELVTSTYALPRPIVFRAQMCDQPNAFYSPEGEVIYCYELAEDMASLYLTDVIQYYPDANAEEQEEDTGGSEDEEPAEEDEMPDAERGGTSSG
ncbi:MAG TPA: DUF4344 domain-containing metallopeptidase [Devosia sp.]|jgi:hypothetical protein